jgi:holin-like protein
VIITKILRFLHCKITKNSPFWSNFAHKNSEKLMILQCAVLFAFLAMGELIVWLTGVPVPSSIIGMLLLAVSLRTGVVKEQWVDKLADFLVKNLGFFFVPAGVGVMRCLGLIRDQWLPIVTATVVSTFVIIAVTGWVHQLARRGTSSITSKTKANHGK